MMTNKKTQIMKNIYVVHAFFDGPEEVKEDFGGSDYIVCAYLDKDEAQKHSDHLNALAMEEIPVGDVPESSEPAESDSDGDYFDENWTYQTRYEVQTHVLRDTFDPATSTDPMQGYMEDQDSSNLDMEDQ